MNEHQKKILSQFESNMRFNLGKSGKCCLSTIISSCLHFANPRDTNLPEYRNNVHPWDYYNYVICWDKIHENKMPVQFDGNRKAFAKYVINEWHKICYKQGFYKFDILSVFDNYDTLIKVEEDMLKGNLTIPGTDKIPDYELHIETLYELGQKLADEKAINEAKEIELTKKRQKTEDYKKPRYFPSKIDVPDAELAKQNREFANKENSPWTSSLTTNSTMGKKSTPTNIDDMSMIIFTEASDHDITVKDFTVNISCTNHIIYKCSLTVEYSGEEVTLSAETASTISALNDIYNKLTTVIEDCHKAEEKAKLKAQYTSSMDSIMKMMEESRKQQEMLMQQFNDIQSKLNAL